jgi:hypothetical protein
MAKHITIISVIIVFLAVAFLVRAEKATELYIPIGQSPGLSGKYTALGKFDQVDLENRAITMSDAAGSYTVKVTEGTFIYLDKSEAQLPNTYGSLADCRVGDKIEVNWEGNARGKSVEWIKVQNLE